MANWVNNWGHLARALRAKQSRFGRGPSHQRRCAWSTANLGVASRAVPGRPRAAIVRGACPIVAVPAASSKRVIKVCSMTGRRSRPSDRKAQRRTCPRHLLVPRRRSDVAPRRGHPGLRWSTERRPGTACGWTAGLGPQGSTGRRRSEPLLGLASRPLSLCGLGGLPILRRHVVPSSCKGGPLIDRGGRCLNRERLFEGRERAAFSAGCFRPSLHGPPAASGVAANASYG